MFGLGSLLADSSVTYQPAVVVDKSLGSERLHWAGDSGILILVVPPGAMPGAGGREYLALGKNRNGPG